MNTLTAPEGFIVISRVHKDFTIILHRTKVTQAMNFPKVQFLGFSIIILLNKMVLVMQGAKTPHDHILDVNENL
jgi:hypothetical protein